MTYTLGLDFGTSFTAAATSRDGNIDLAMLGSRAASVPAVVFVRGDGTFLHGDDAHMRGTAEPLGLVRNLKRSLGDLSHVVVDENRLETVGLVAEHLRWAVDRVVAQEGAAPTSIILTHPASWRASRLEGLKQAITRAGIECELLTEPHAAAAFHAESYPLAVGDLVAAYDLGGGTFDAAVLRRTRRGFELAGEPEGQAHLGGLDFDDVVLHLVQSRVGEEWKAAEAVGGRSFDIAVAGVRRECELAKEWLSQEEEVLIPVLLPGVATQVTVTRRDLNHLIRPSIEETIGSFHRAVAGAGATIADLSAVLMVGGSCQLPIVRELLGQAVGDGVDILDSDPRHAVARGAALEAAERLSQRAAEAAPVIAESVAEPSVEPAPVLAAQTPTAATVPAAAAVPATAVPATVAAETENRSKAPLVGLAAAGFVVAALVGGFLVTRGGGDSDIDIAGETTEQAVPSDQGGAAAEATATTLSSDAGSDSETAPVVAEDTPSSVGMVEIASGTYTVGVDEPGAESVASFEVEARAFVIDAFEVTNDEYVAFVQQIGAPPPISWERGVAPADLGDHPVTGVEFVWAEAYCSSLDKRLPTEAEWEVAARGPNGALYPTGDTPEGLDLDTPGTRPVGSNAANVNGFGVFDAVGSVWEWVGEPYVPIDDDQRVRRGGLYGRVRDGAAMRQPVDPSGQATINETGFRCAADMADPSVEPLIFELNNERPADAEEDSGPEAAASGGDSILVNDSFDDTGSGFLDITEDTWRIGYHAPSWYHLEATQTDAQVLSLGGYNLADGEVELSVYIDSLATEAGEYRYGLVFRAGDELRAPPVGIAGPERPSVYYAFVINPRAGIWELLHEDELPLRAQASGPLPPVTVLDPNATDVLGVTMEGTSVTLSVNGEVVNVFDTLGFHTEAGNLGLFLETFDEELVHAHFDLLTVDGIS